MGKGTTKAELLRAIREESAGWNSLLAEVGEERMLLPGVVGEWNFKDLAAHLTGWLRHELRRADAARRGTTPAPPAWPSGLDTDEINQWIYEQNRERPLADVLQDSRAAIQAMLDAVNALPEAELMDPGRFAWNNGQALGPSLVASFDHLHQEHEQGIREWLHRIDTPMSMDTFLNRVRTARDDWERLLAEVGEARLVEPGVAGEWSVKDVVAHLTWHEREMIGVAREHALVGSELWELPMHRRNQTIFEQNRERPLEDVLAESRQIYAPLLESLEGLSEEDLNDASRFRDMPGEWVPWQILAGNTYEHYRAHIPAVRAWLDSPSEATLHD